MFSLCETSPFSIILQALHIALATAQELLKDKEAEGEYRRNAD